MSSIWVTMLRIPDGKSVFLSSGSEAVDLSISISKHITGRNRICIIDGSYLSAYGHGKDSLKDKTANKIPAENFEKLSSLNFEKIAAFVFEPGTAWRLIQFSSAGFVSAIVKKAKSAGSLIIVDEVTTGMCRTGKWFGFEHYSMNPDIVVCGKGLGNGYPVSSVSLSKKITKAFEEMPFRYAQSHQNDPFACAVALQVIKEMDRKGLVTKTEEKGILFKSLLKETARKHNSIKEIRGRGLMIAIEFHEKDLAEKVHEYLFQHRMIAGLKSNVVRLMPPLIINDSLIHQVVDAVDNSLVSLNPL